MLKTGDPAEESAALVDLLASEYGWEPDAILNMPIDQTPQLIHAILARKGVKVYRTTPDVERTRQSLCDRIKSIFDSIE